MLDQDSIATLGECMPELTHQVPAGGRSVQPMNLAYGGATLNTAVYLARRGTRVEYLTALGDDPMSGYLAARVASIPPGSAANAGHALASGVVQHRGAIIPVDAMPAEL